MGKAILYPTWLRALVVIPLSPPAPKYWGDYRYRVRHANSGGATESWSGQIRPAYTKEHRDFTTAFRAGASKTLELAQKNGVKMAILKDHSPSCGCNRIYDGTFSRRLVAGRGVTAALLKKHGIEVIAETDWAAQRRGNDV